MVCPSRIPPDAAPSRLPTNPLMSSWLAGPSRSRVDAPPDCVTNACPFGELLRISRRAARRTRTPYLEGPRSAGVAERRDDRFYLVIDRAHGAQQLVADA